MDEGDDGYVPQISQIDYNLMDSGTNGSSSTSSYYNPMTSHLPGIYGNADMQHQYQHSQMMQGQSMPSHAYPGMSAQMPQHGMMGQSAAMMPAVPQQSAPPQPPSKPKRGGRKKNVANQPTSTDSITPAQQPLPASYSSHQMTPQMMQQIRQQSYPPGGYPMQSPQVQQKWPGADYNMQQQYRPIGQQPYPAGGYPMHPSAQNYYAANQQQRPPPQYYQQQQPYPPHYPGQTPQQPRYSAPQPNQQQYYMDPNIYNYQGHTATASGYPQATQPSHSQQQKPDIMVQQSFQQQTQASAQQHPYQQTKVPPSTPIASNISQPNHMPPAVYSGQQAAVSSQQGSQWPGYNGVPPNYYQQQPNSLQNLQREIVELERQYQQYSYQQKTPEICMRMDQLYKKICYLKQQHQQMSMQQPASQQSPQTTSKTVYPNFASNGQVVDSSTPNTAIPPMSSASSVHHTPSTDKLVTRPPPIPAQDPNSSVAVMQTAANQVQVNITPEAPGGRTLISVYHQYPSTDVVTNSTNTALPVATNYKDTIPPEPVPSSFSASDQKQLYARNQSQIEISSTPSTSTINTTATTESKPQTIPNTVQAIDYPKFSSSQQPTASASPVPPQPIPTTSYSTTSRQQSLENSNDLAKQADEKLKNDSILSVKSEPSGEKHTVDERVRNRSDKSQRSNNDKNAVRESVKPSETEPFENELDDLQPPAAPRMISNYEEDEEDEEVDVRPRNEEMTMEDKPEPCQPEVALVSTQQSQLVEGNNKLVPNSDQSRQATLPSQASNYEPMQLNEPEKPAATPAVDPVQSYPPGFTEVSASAPALGAAPAAASFKFEEVEATPMSQSVEMAEVPEEAPAKSIKNQLKKKAPRIRNRKPTTNASSRKRKRLDAEDDDDVNTDNEFIPDASSKKRAKGKINVATAIRIDSLIEEQKLEDFVEKRRSERNRSERKTYSEKMDIDEELLEEVRTVGMPSVENSPAQLAALEWVVEKILGVRIVTKMLPKEQLGREKDETPSQKPEQSATNETDDKTTEEPESKTTKNETEAEQKKEESNADDKPAAVDNDEEAKPSEKGAEEAEQNGEQEVELEEVQVEEIYVKFKGKSYLHCEWKSVEELEEIDKRIVGKINRFKAKYGESYLDDSEYFNDDYTVVDRVLDEHVEEETNKHLAYVKWRSLPYEDCTWEDIVIVPKSKLEEFHQRNDIVDPFKVKERSRPTADEWVKIPPNKMYKFENTLRDYQFEGVNWLLFCYFQKQNCILADEMGLGKTIQSITFLQGVYDKDIHGPFLIVVPLSTLHNWEREIENWTHMNAIVYHGSSMSREIIQDYEFYYNRGDSKKKQIVKFDVLLTTYEMVVLDCEVLRKFNYRVCIIDEAHRLKNRNSKLLTGGLLSFRMEHRVLLTGTPLQNNVQELFSLLNFLEPTQFCNSESFLEQFGQCQTEEQVQKLQEILKPMMLRRLKEDVEKTLQPKEETIIEVQLTNTQKKYYRAILERNFTHLIKGSSVPSLMNTMMELRKVCNHPFLLRGAEEQIISEFKPLHADKSEDELQLLSLVQASGKMVLIDKLLPKLRQDGHKVLIFSQMVRVLDIIEEFLAQMNYLYERIDGNVRGDHRQAAIDRFSKPDSDRFVFLLCTRAGGLGINLTAADTVIIFDSDWNPQNDLQAQARCHRIGQTKMVKVYRLITANTYEREMFDKASLKLGLDKAVLQSTGPKDSQQQLSRKEVEDLLKKGAYGSIMSDENEGNKFSEEDIDTILSRRTQTIRLEPGIKGSTFAKASFASNSNREDIDVNDPNFWAKWAKKANVDVDAGQNELIMSEPRARRKRFEDNYKGLHEGENESDLSDSGSNEPSASKNRNRNTDLSKSRSGKKRKRNDDDDDDYINYNAPDELTFNKSEFFKVEKLLSAWGWGRWKTIKEHSDVVLSEKDIEHIARTLLLHCIREYRGDEKSREFVWQLIVPKGGVLGKGGKKGVVGGGLYHEGWATLPEYNPPAFAVDSSFQRHVHRHANKLMQRMFHLFVLQAQILGSVDEAAVQNKSHSEIQLDVPVVGDPPLPNWDNECDKSFLIGIYKHGMENFEAIRADSKLCFLEKKIEEMPTTIELNTRFKRIILMLSRKLEMALAAATNAQNTNRLKKWPRAEETEFMRLLRIYGVKDDHEGLNVINWNRFRELSTNLQQKTDAELLEELYCVLAMCTKQQGGDLSDVDRRRASLVDLIPAKQAERLMFRLHLMRKIHAIITTGIQNVRTSLKLCSNKTMPNGWGELHDEQLMIVVDMHGLDNVVSKVTKLPAFEKLKDVVDEQTLLRRVMEICTTLETGRWNGKGSIEMLDDEGCDSGSQTPIRSLNQQLSKRSSRKKNSTSVNPLGTSASPASASQVNQTALQTIMEAAMTNPNYLLPLLNATSGSSSSSSSSMHQQQLQQFQAIMTMYALSTMIPMSDSSTANKQAMAALAMMGEDALNLTMNPKKTTTTASQSTSSTSKPTTSSVTTAPTTSSSSKSAAPVADLSSQYNISELLALFNIPEETNIPVINVETGTKLSGDKAPRLKNLDQWLNTHPKYRVDTSVMSGSASTTSSNTKETASALKAEKSEPTTSNGIFKTSALEPGEIPKTLTTLSTTTTTTESKKTDTDVESVRIGVFHKSTGVALPQDKWPSISNLESWLNKNMGTQVQSMFAPFAKELLPKNMHDRIGGEPSLTTQSTSASSSIQQAASSAAAASNLTNAMNLEALQIQLYLQQKMLESLNPTSYPNPYSSMLGSGVSGSASSSMNPAISSSSGLDPNSTALLALFGAQMPSTTIASQTSSSQNVKSSTSVAMNSNTLNSAFSSNASSSLMNEAALTAEILANPSLALLLNNGAMTNNNASSLNNSTALFPFNMDFNTALQLNALTSTGNLNPISQASPNVNSTSIASLLSGVQSAVTTSSTVSKKSAQTTSSSAGRASKLNAVVEKLASSSNMNSNS